VWAYGLRNPWRFSFDRGAPSGDGRGDLWIGDVGQNAWEEVDRQAAGAAGGANYGWSRFEGTHTYNAGREAPGAVAPVAEYSHSDGGGTHCSVTGGYVYRGDAIPDLQGTYLFGDFCSGFLWTLEPSGSGWRRELALDTGLNISSFGEDEDGELYVVDHGGEVRKVVAA
jgi:glucose/arabinose dehydrogenase